MNNVVDLELPLLELVFYIKQERMDGIIERANKIGDGQNIEFKILLKSEGDTFTFTSRSTGPVEEIERCRECGALWGIES